MYIYIYIYTKVYLVQILLCCLFEQQYSYNNNYVVLPHEKTHISSMGQNMNLSFYDAKIINTVYCGGN